MKIMVLLEAAEIRDLIVFNLETKLKVEIIEPSSESEAIGLLFTAQDLDLIIIDGDQKWASFLKVAKEKKQSTAFVCILTNLKKQASNLDGLRVLEVIPKGKLLERLPFILREYFFDRGDADVSNSVGHPLYCRVPTSLLLRFSPLKADIYIRLSQDKFVKLFVKGDVFDKDDLEKYLIQKKIKFLHILNKNAGEFSEKLERELLTVLNTEGVTNQELDKAAVTTVDIIRELREKLGFTPEVQSLIKTTCKVMAKSASTHTKLKELFRNLAKNTEHYTAVHSLSLSQIACSIATAMEWSSESTFQKLTMAAIMHDITLINPNLAEVRSALELNLRRTEFTDADVKNYLAHPAEASDLTLLMDEILPDVDAILLQHHEQPDGSGFPHQLSGIRISPLSALFIVAHDLVFTVMHTTVPMTIPAFVKKNRDKYSSGNFKRVLAALAKVKE